MEADEIIAFLGEMPGPLLPFIAKQRVLNTPLF
jgi:hypothetical protein